MATPIHAKKYSETWNSVTVCSAQFGLDFSADAGETTTSCDSAKTFLAGKYGWTASSSGPADFANSGGDDTMYAGIIAGTAANLVFVPDGDSSVGTANPSYTGSAFLTSYSLSADVGSVVQYSAAYQGTGANTRAES